MAHLFRRLPQANRYYAWFTALHTRVDLLLLGHFEEPEFEAAEVAVRDELLAVERMGNRFDPKSELSVAVRSAVSTGAAVLSPELFNLLSRCLQANKETEGLFDITVNSPCFYPGLINTIHLEPFTATAGTTAISRASLPSLTGGVPVGRGGSLFVTIPESPSLTGEVSVGQGGSLVLDLSGILKGYALERLRQLLSAFGIADALVNLGNSSILSLGQNPSDIPSGSCLTTSGNASASRRHIRNPLTGEFVTGARTVSVTTADGVDGEIASIVEFLRTAQDSTAQQSP